MAVVNLGNTRMLRTLLVFKLIIFTIFIYALYSTTSTFNPEISISQKITADSGRQQEEQLTKLPSLMEMVELNNTGEFGLSSGVEEQKRLRKSSSHPSADSSHKAETSNEGDLRRKQINTDTVTSMHENKSEPGIREDPKENTPQQVLLEIKDSPNLLIETEKLYESGHLNEEIDVDRICSLNGLSTRLVVLITSALKHADARMSIRQTWGHYGARRDVGIAFVLGRSTNRTVNEALSEENSLYGDLIRGNYIDSYNNLTLKVISALEWADLHCHHAKYLLKTDDDMFINVPMLLSFTADREKRKQKRAIFGRLAHKWKPVRNKKSKYYVSINQYPEKVYPTFTTGPAYLMTGDIIHDLYVGSLKKAYLNLEDVFITGFVAQSLDIERFHVYEFINRRIGHTSCNIRKSISLHMVKSSEQFDLWQKLQNQTAKC
ncbi:beta-1,3-galactosyltransferase 5-like [Drosophila innubila]|uniref:beta-1,3-galactosyltransferase 5-like n=1 Tax=Drosophila innubila TaxID=198719 RepID=UPI00148E2AAC|nr:beta-1,3-galactosyltransferase 5-like [Drosophila innubila]